MEVRDGMKMERYNAGNMEDDAGGNIIIETEKLSKEFGRERKKVLESITLSVRKGEIFGLLGPSGAGKTTLIRILTGQLSYGGTARIFGKDCSRPDKSFYERIGIMSDNSGLYDRLSCGDNLKIFAKIYGMKEEIVKEQLQKAGLEGAMKTPAGKLSKGMKQRLVLARALLGSPEILFLDEPTSGLDPASSREIHKLLVRLRENGCTIFLTTHNMEEAQKLCQRVALLNDGIIVECGQPKDLCIRYNRKNTITAEWKGGSVITVPNSAEGKRKLIGMLGTEDILTVHSSEPNLEQVFIELTGRELVS